MHKRLNTSHRISQIFLEHPRIMHDITMNDVPGINRSIFFLRYNSRFPPSPQWKNIEGTAAMVFHANCNLPRIVSTKVLICGGRRSTPW
ncbi:hypothetical protein K443DRAFT_683437 [Laccaria amethystina LaAM-08-1]|uniref:Uncharacterized protein n=1 Tax=Laccaria amethystina LaAM-08-1 TaxID=1095629 RepID=A0A0C9XAV6_9AGAR|nr:hypothetical protein K443DRAFT_683437 [Laccaria amethystina LaAM-08-1]